MKWIEYENYYVARFERYYNLHKKSFEEEEFDVGVGVLIGENKSKLKSGDYKIGEVVFDKEYFSFEDAYDYFRNLDFRFTRRNVVNKKVPPIIILVDLEEKGYLYGVLRNHEKTDTIAHQMRELEPVEESTVHPFQLMDLMEDDLDIIGGEYDY